MAAPSRLVIAIVEADNTTTERSIELAPALSRNQQATLLDILVAMGRSFLGPPNRISRMINQL